MSLTTKAISLKNEGCLNDYLGSFTNRDSTVSPSISVAGQSFTNVDDLPIDPLMLDLEDTTNLLNTGIFSGAYDDVDVGAEADLNNLETTMNKDWRLVDLPKGKHAIGTKWVYRNKKDERGILVRNKARLVAQGYTQEEGIDYDEVFAPVARIEAIKLFLAYASFMGFIVYQINVKSAFLYGTIEEEVYVCQPPGFEDPQFPNKVYKVEKALYGLHQAPRAWYETLSTYLLENGFRRGIIDKTLFIKKGKGDILLVHVYVDDIIFGSTKKSLCVMQRDDGIFISQDKYVADILKKFYFVTMKIASTPIETHKELLKDEEAEDVDVHLYRLMIGSLMYLIASRPDITFAVYACARFQVTPKVSHLHAVKRIFKYLKGQPKLGLWYPRDSPFDLKSFSNSDYVGASLDRKSTTGGCQFLGKRYSYEKRLIQGIKIHTDHNVADLLTKAFDVSSIRDKFGNKTGSRKVNTARQAKHIEYMWSPKKVGDEAVHKELGDRMERAATTASSLEAEQDSEQFWQTATAPTLENGDMEITATIDRKVKIVSEGRQEYDLEPNFKFTAPEEVYTVEPDISTANVPVSTTGTEVSTAAESLVYIRRSAAKRKDKVLFEATMKRVNTFTSMESDDTVPKVIVRSSKRGAEELGKESLKRQKIGEGSEPAEESKDKESDELSQEQLQ
ncbi:putative ribonuclease H-like domain-containing protein [Tanacetum coccineum]